MGLALRPIGFVPPSGIIRGACPIYSHSLIANVVKKWDRHRTLNRCVARTRLGAEPVPFFHNLVARRLML